MLETYNEERLPNAHRLLRTTDRFFEFGASDEWFISFVRTYIFPYVFGFAVTLDVVKKAIFPLVSQIGINYRESSLSQDHSSFLVKAGDRMPYFQVYNQSIYDRMREPKFHLLAFGGDGFVDVGGDLKDILDVRNLALTNEVEDIFGTDKPFILVVRPDNYIGLISEKMSLEAVRDYLENVIGN